MVVLNIAELIGTPNAIIQKFGLQVFNEAKAKSRKGEKVELFFGGLKNATTGFFHASVGNLVKEYTDDYYKFIKISGLDKNVEWLGKYNDAIDLAINPHKADEIDSAIAELFIA